MKNPLSIFKKGPADCDLVEDVKEILHSKAWWQEKRDSFDQLHIDSEHSDTRFISLASYSQDLNQQPCFGDDEESQMPYPDTDDYYAACRAWGETVEEFQNTNPAFYAVWDLGEEDLGRILEGLQTYASGQEISPGHWESIGFSEIRGRFVTNPDFESMHRLASQLVTDKVSAQGLFGNQVMVFDVGSRMGISRTSMLNVSGAQNGLENFQDIAQAYDQEQDRGKAVLEEWAGKLGAALAKVEEEHTALHQYLSQAEEKYAEYKRREAEASMDDRLWGSQDN